MVSGLRADQVEERRARLWNHFEKGAEVYSSPELVEVDAAVWAIHR